MKQINPYVSVQDFRGQQPFYEAVFGGEFVGITEHEGLVMHAEMHLGDSILYMNDIFPHHPITSGNQVTIMLAPDSEEELRSVFTKLADGGTVGMEPTEMFWNAIFATVTDRNGVTWSLNFQK